MKILQEFREFAMKGNVIDLAVGVIIGAAFGKIVTSLVEDIIMPPVGKAIGNMDFTNLYVPLYSFPVKGSTNGVPWEITEWPKTLAEAKKLGSVVAYGNFLTVTINFVIVAFCIFLIIKAMNSAKKKFDRQKEVEAAAPAVPPADVVLLTEIRDLLKVKN